MYTASVSVKYTLGELTNEKTTVPSTQISHSRNQIEWYGLDLES